MLYASLITGSLRGSTIHCAKMSQDNVLAAIAYCALGFSYSETAKVFGVSKSAIGHAVTGRSWGHAHKYHKSLMTKERQQMLSSYPST